MVSRNVREYISGKTVSWTTLPKGTSCRIASDLYIEHQKVASYCKSEIQKLYDDYHKKKKKPVQDES